MLFWLVILDNNKSGLLDKGIGSYTYSFATLLIIYYVLSVYYYLDIFF